MEEVETALGRPANAYPGGALGGFPEDWPVPGSHCNFLAAIQPIGHMSIIDIRTHLLLTNMWYDPRQWHADIQSVPVLGPDAYMLSLIHI